MKDKVDPAIQKFLNEIGFLEFQATLVPVVDSFGELLKNLNERLLQAEPAEGKQMVNRVGAAVSGSMCALAARVMGQCARLVSAAGIPLTHSLSLFGSDFVSRMEDFAHDEDPIMSDGGDTQH